jgi:glycosyltransferase involved in cell wall biosynthesis
MFAELDGVLAAAPPSCRRPALWDSPLVLVSSRRSSPKPQPRRAERSRRPPSLRVYLGRQLPALTRMTWGYRVFDAASPRRPAHRGLFVSWAPFSRRTETLARWFDLDTVYVRAPWFNRPLLAPLRYSAQILRTYLLLVAASPDEVWVMDPPAPAVLTTWLYCWRRGIPLVVDMHTIGFYAPRWRIFRPLEMPALRYAARNVVTNSQLASRVVSWGCRAAILTDPLPKPPDVSDVRPEPGSVTVIATFSDDEPIAQLPLVAQALPQMKLYVTGRPRGDVATWPRNLIATGFVGDTEFWMRLAASEVILVLTTRPNTLLSGGYEALSLGKPLVISDQLVLRDYFGDAAVYVDASAEGIATGVLEAFRRAPELAQRSVALARLRETEWSEAARRLRAAILGHS